MRARLPSAQTLVLAAVAAAALALPSAAGAAGPTAAGRLDPAAASRLIERARAAIDPTQAEGARVSAASRRGDLTPVLLRLARALPGLSDDQRSAVRGLLSRPTDNPDPDGQSYGAAALDFLASHCSLHFCVHWIDNAGFDDAPDLTDTAPANGVPDYVDQVEGVAEEVYSTENGALGWRPPKSDGVLGGNNRTDVYLAEIGDTLFGYASPDPSQGGRRRFAYLVLDDDYAPSQFPGTIALEDIEVTLAHEYCHVLQFGYDTFQDTWFLESSAVWMEDQVFDSVDDYLRYLSRWNQRASIPLTQSNIKMYGSGVWNHWLSQRYGAGVVRSAWSKALDVQPAAFSVGSYDAAIRAAGNSDFSLDFSRFARDVSEWRTGTAFPEGLDYPDAQRQGHLATDRRAIFRRLDHTTFRLLRVKPKTARALRVEAAVLPGTAAALAVVGRIGSETGGSSVSQLRLKRGGGRLSVSLSRPQRFQRITVALINADADVNGIGSADWHYTGNGVSFGVLARLIR